MLCCLIMFDDISCYVMACFILSDQIMLKCVKDPIRCIYHNTCCNHIQKYHMSYHVIQYISLFYHLSHCALLQCFDYLKGGFKSSNSVTRLRDLIEPNGSIRKLNE